jgi:hypothetical protein
MCAYKICWKIFPSLFTAVGLLSACAAPVPNPEEQAASAALASKGDPDRLLIVDCLLPGQIRKLGSQFIYLSPRRPVKTSASDCEIRGGEYVAYDRADYKTALRVWLPQAQGGDPVAQTYVGEIYERGLGVAPDYAMAAQWYRKAAEQGYSRAQINLGALYEQGLGVDKDATIALNWYRKASGLNDDQLAFTSAFTAERDELQQEVALREQEANLLRERLAQTEQQLKTRRSSVDAMQRELDATRRQLQQRQIASQTAVPVAVAAPDAVPVEQLETRLDEQEALIALQNQELTYLQQETERQQAQLRAELQAAERRAQGLESDLAFEEQERQSLEEQVSYLQTQLVKYQNTLNDRKRLLQSQQRQLREAEQALNQQQKERSSQNEAETERLRRELNSKNQKLDTTQQQVARLETQVQVRQKELAKLRALRVQQVDIDIEAQPTLVKRSGGAQATSVSANAPLPKADLNFGNYHALIIGNNEYTDFPDLDTAISDAQAMANLLEGRYGFQTRVLTNATRYQMLSALNEFRGKLTEKENFLLYYAGHGELDKANARGHWLPVDAESTSTANWISNVQVTDILNTMNAKHIMVIADSCYSGTLVRSVTTSIEGGRTDEKRVSWLKVMINTPSRTVLTSGGLSPVLDSGGGGEHSIFANVLLEVLNTNNDILEGPLLYRQVSTRVQTSAAELGQEQEPLYAPIKFAGDLGAPFFFVPLN